MSFQLRRYYRLREGLRVEWREARFVPSRIHGKFALIKNPKWECGLVDNVDPLRISRI